MDNLRVPVSCRVARGCGPLVALAVSLFAADAHAGTPIDMEVGYEHNCVINDCDSTWCWGNYNQYFGEDADRSAPFSDIAVGNDHTCGLELLDPSRPAFGGPVECWGRAPGGRMATEPNEWSLVDPPEGNFRQIDGGNFVTCGIRAQGTANPNTAECWGWDNNNVTTDIVLNPQQRVVEFAQVSAGDGFACGVTSGRSSIYCWGGEPGGIRRLPIADVREFSGEKWSKVSAGADHVCALSDYGDGTGGGAIYCWGSDKAGQLVPESGGGSSFVSTALSVGDTQTVHRVVFTDPAGDYLYNFDVSAGGAATCVTREETVGSPSIIECWGFPFTPSAASMTLWGTPTTEPPLPAGFTPSSVFLGLSQLCAIDDLGGDIECWSLWYSTPLGILDRNDPACGRINCTADDVFACI